LYCLFHVATLRLFNDIDFSRDIENFQLQLNTYGGFLKPIHSTSYRKFDE